MGNAVIPDAETATFKQLAHRLEREIKARGFFSSRFQGKSTEHIIVEGAGPEKGASEMFLFNLRDGPHCKPVHGDDLVIDTADKLATHAYAVVMGLFPQEARFPRAKVAKPSLSDLRKCLEEQYVVQFVEAVDAMIIKYLTGSWTFGPDVEHTGLFHPDVMIDQQYNVLFARTFLDQPHYIFAGDAHSKHTLTAEDKLNRGLLDIATSRARMMTEDYPKAPEMRPARVGNSEYYAVILHPHQAFDLRRDLGERGWSEIEGNLADSEVRGQPAAKDALGIIDNMILYSHPSIATYMGGENADVPCAAALFLGCQAGMIAYGGFAKGERVAGSRRNPKHEKKPPFVLQQLMGFNTCRYGAEFGNCDCGVIRMDTAAHGQMTHRGSGD